MEQMKINFKLAVIPDRLFDADTDRRHDLYRELVQKHTDFHAFARHGLRGETGRIPHFLRKLLDSFGCIRSDSALPVERVADSGDGNTRHLCDIRDRNTFHYEIDSFHPVFGFRSRAKKLRIDRTIYAVDFCNTL